MATYAEILRDPRWQRKRLEILNRSNFTCEECGATDKTLNVHHKHYRKGAKPWEYEEFELVCLCEACHRWEHEYKEHLTRLVAGFNRNDRRAVLQFALDLGMARSKQRVTQRLPPDSAPHIDATQGAN